MSAIVPSRKVLQLASSFRELVVPSDVSGLAFDYQYPYVLSGPTSVAEFADKYVLYEINRLSVAGALERTSVKRGGRAIHLILKSSALLASAPATVQTLASSLGPQDQRFVVWSQARGDVWLVAGRTEGLRHAMFDYLYRLGVKYIGPHKSWAVRPASMPELDCAELMAPALNTVYFSGNGGLNTHAVTFAGAIKDAQALAATQWIDWNQQVGLPSESYNFIGNDGGESFTSLKQNALAADHSQLAWNAQYGKRGVRDLSGNGFPTYCFATDAVISKICVNHHGTVNAGPGYPARPTGGQPWTGIRYTGPFCTVGSSPRDVGTNDPGPDTATPPAPSDYTSFDGVFRLFIEHTRDVICQFIDTSTDNFHPNNLYASVSPNDGPFQCECTKCRDMVRDKYGGTRDSTPSDLVFDLATETAKFFAYFFANSATVKPKVCVSGYADHADTPAFPLHPELCVTLLPQTIAGRTNETVGEVVSNWANFRATNSLGTFPLGMQCTWQGAAERDSIKMNTRDAIAQFKRFLSMGYTLGFSTQCSYSNIACGPQQYAIARLAWRPALSADSLLAEWFSPLGAAAAQCQATYERMGDWFELIPHSIGQLFLDMQAAQAALSSDPHATADQQTCLDHFRAWVQWLRLYYELLQTQTLWVAGGSPTTGSLLANMLTAIDNATLHGWNMSLSMNAIQADLHVGEYLYKQIPATGTGTATLRAKWDKSNAGSAGFVSVAEPTTAGLTSIINAGAAAYPLVSGVTRRAFGFQMFDPRFSSLASFTGTLVPLTTTTDTTLVNTLNACTAYQVFRFKKGASSVTFSLTSISRLTPVGIPVRIRVLDDAGNQLQLFQYTPTAVSVTTPFTITVPAGSYTLEFNDLAGLQANQYLSWPRNVPLVQLYITQLQGFQQSVKVYFYVPLGETHVVMAFNNAPYGPCNMYDDTGASVTVTTDGYAQYVCAVPAGHSGKVWSFDHIQSANNDRYPHFVNCPDLFAFDPLHMMVPSGLDGH